MKWIGILALAAVGMILLVLAAAYICFRLAFYVPKKRPASKDEYPIPEGAAYEPFREQMITWIKQTRALPQVDMQIKSFDGLTLRGKYYEYAPGAPIELMLHGYRGSSERDMSGGVQRCFALGRSALIVDQRCHGRSDGTVITFGIREYRDCLSWVEHMIRYFGPDVKIILTGISMGAATVLMAAGQEDLPKNVVGVLADCGYTSPRQIIESVMRSIHLPPKIFFPLMKLGARLYGGFDLEEYSPLEAVQRCRVPVIFYHGEADGFVPCHMSQQNYDACVSRKAIVTIPGADHGLSFPVDQATYLSTLEDFFREELQ